MTDPSQSAPPTRYRVVHPPDRQDGSGQGVTREFGISQSSAGSSHLSMAYGVVPAGATSTRHDHPFETAVFVIASRARAYFGLSDEEWVDVGAGDFLYMYIPVHPGRPATQLYRPRLVRHRHDATRPEPRVEAGSAARRWASGTHAVRSASLCCRSLGSPAAPAEA